MHLEKLEIQGFKSFAAKNMLLFPDPKEGKKGMTVIVGPNGSGKSNIADAVRWALGEQSMKTLRGKKSEDVIFSGSDKKGKLGMAEVSLFLNNEDRKAPLDYSEIVLTRRLYRNGDSEYLLNNSKARLADIQILLAKSNFGQKTYSVIGQGIVEGFLNTSLAERKEFFDEATGVKQFQIKRDDALGKLRLSYENLSQAQMLGFEIEPRLKSLTKQVNRLKRRTELEAKLREMQLIFYSGTWKELSARFTAFSSELLEKEKRKGEKDRKLESLRRELEGFETNASAVNEYATRQSELKRLQAEKDSFIKSLALIQAEEEVRLEKAGNFDLSWLKTKEQELDTQIKNIEIEIKELAGKKSQESERINRYLSQAKELEEKISDLNSRLKKAEEKFDIKDFKEISFILNSINSIFSGLKGESDIEIITIKIEKAGQELQKAIEISGRFDEQEKLGLIRSELFAFAEEKDVLNIKLNESRLNLQITQGRENLLKDRLRSIAAENSAIVMKINRYSGADKGQTKEGEKEDILEKLTSVEEKMRKAQEKLEAYSRDEEEKRKRMLELQRSAQDSQDEINAINRDIESIRIGSARCETKLEDIESQIRQGLCSLKEIKEYEHIGEIDPEALQAKIQSLKRQLEHIGGIDPEIEQEYIDTKGRYDFLSGQTDDLVKAIASLETVIKELDVEIRRKFDEEFKVISKKFEEYFKILFNGGNAKIIKVLESDLVAVQEEDGESAGDQAEKKTTQHGSSFDLAKIKYLQKHNATGLAGIEIQATPPGKKIKTLSMLSGGERALTAIALLCAIISANPSPFVVLDEVDAALDEANSERLAKILDDLSSKTQFIVISHNRASMRKAQILYGVTMQDDGVSKLLSIKLEDAPAGKQG